MTDPTEVLTKLREFCEKYFKSRPSSSQKLELIREFNKIVPTICPKLCERLNTEILDKEPNVLNITGQCVVFGDIHGNLEDMYDYEKQFWGNETEKSIYVFLGDFVDRGAFSVEVSLYLLSLKLLDPNKFILVRGNHEVRVVNKGYTFYNECITKYGSKEGNEVWDQINCCFERLPFAAIIDKVVFCCHGGVPKSVTKVEDMQRIPKPLIDPAVEAMGAHEILWNDPIESMATYSRVTERVLRQKRVEFVPNKARSTGYYFTVLAAKRFMETNGFLLIIRAHESVNEGYKYTTEGKVLTVFSSSNYCGKNNTTACVKVGSGSAQVVLIKIPSKTQNSTTL